MSELPSLSLYILIAGLALSSGSLLFSTENISPPSLQVLDLCLQAEIEVTDEDTELLAGDVAKDGPVRPRQMGPREGSRLQRADELIVD